MVVLKKLNIELPYDQAISLLGRHPKELKVNRNRHMDIENKFMVNKGEREGRINYEFGVDIYTLLYIKWVTNKDLLYSSGDYTQYFLILSNL